MSSPPDSQSTNKDDSSSLPPEDLKRTTASKIKGPMAVAQTLCRIFSGVGPRDAPSSSKTVHIRLITIAVSHYCEKVRWVLDLLEDSNDNPYYFTEDGHAPAFVSFETVKASKDTLSVSPMILYKDEKTGKEELLAKSNVIMESFYPSLYPDDIKKDVQDMEAYLGRELGPTVRCLAYYHLLKNLDSYHDTMVNACANPSLTSTIENVLFDKMLDKGIDKGMKKVMCINDDTAKTSLVALRKVFAEISKRLDDNGGGEYLMDTPAKKHGFTAADVTFCSLAYPLLRPPEMQVFLVNQDDLPPALNDLTKELLETTAGQYVLNIYKKHRPVSSGGVVEFKTARRDRYPWEHATFRIGAGIASAIALAAACTSPINGGGNNKE